MKSCLTAPRILSGVINESSELWPVTDLYPLTSSACRHYLMFSASNVKSY